MPIRTSVNVTNYIAQRDNGGYDLADNQGENMLKAFASMVRGSSTMDGDIRLDQDGKNLDNYVGGAIAKAA